MYRRTCPPYNPMVVTQDPPDPGAPSERYPSRVRRLPVNSGRDLAFELKIGEIQPAHCVVRRVLLDPNDPAPIDPIG